MVGRNGRPISAKATNDPIFPIIHWCSSKVDRKADNPGIQQTIKLVFANFTKTWHCVKVPLGEQKKKHFSPGKLGVSGLIEVARAFFPNKLFLSVSKWSLYFLFAVWEPTYASSSHQIEPFLPPSARSRVIRVGAREGRGGPVFVPNFDARIISHFGRPLFLRATFSASNFQGENVA